MKVFEYGCLAPTLNARRVDEQMRLAHRYKNRLVELERARRAAVRACMNAASETVVALKEQIDSLKEAKEKVCDEMRARRARQRKNVEIADLRAELQRIVAELQALYPLAKAASQEARPLIKAHLDAIEARHAEAERHARADSGLYWGTYLQVEQAADASRNAASSLKEDHDPRFRRWDGHGHLAVQLQGGLDAADVQGAGRLVQIDTVAREAWTHPSRGERRRLCRTKIRLRVGSDEREPIWTELPMVMHRPLPEGSRVKWAHLIRERIASHDRWKVQLVIDDSVSPARPVPPATGGMVAADLGWRITPAGMRVAYLVDDAGVTRELALPRLIASGLDRSHTLRSTRDEAFDGQRAWLGMWLESAGDVPDWLREATKTLAQWRSCARLASVVLRWRSQRFEHDGEAFARLEAWRKQDKHLWEWEANQRDKVIGQRREIFRCWAAKLAAQYEILVLEDFDLRDVAEKPSAEREVDDKAASRAQRVEAAPSILRNCLTQAFESRGREVRFVPPEYTTMKCHACQELCEWDQAAEVWHVCEHCGVEWDQDDNAACNLLALASAEVPDGGGEPLATEKTKDGRWKRRKAARDANLEGVAE